MSELEPIHRSILEHELAEVRRSIAELTVTEGYLLRRLGTDPQPAEGSSTPTPDGAAPSRSGAAATGNVADLINPMQFYGRSTADAAAEVLGLVGRTRPLRTREVFDALRKGGHGVKSTEVTGKMMKRSPKFHQLEPGRWGLSEWYPASVRAKGSTDDDLQPDANGDAGEVFGAETDTSNDENEVSRETG